MQHFKKFILFLTVLNISCTTQSKKINNNSSLEPITEQNNSSLVYLSGTPENIATEYAKHFSKDTEYLISNWLKPRMDAIPQGGKQIALNKVNKMKAYIPNEYKAEIEAIAKKLSIDSQDIYLANAAADIGQHLSEGNFLGCSSYIVEPSKSKTGHMIFGRNLDYSNSLALAKRWTPVVFAKPGKLKILSIHAPGMSGILNGINEKGVILMIHVSSGATSSNGIPSSIGFRHVLERATSTDHAVKILKSLSWTFAMNIVVADGKTSAIVEVDAKTKKERLSEGKGLLFATNHFRTQEQIGSASPKEGVRWKALEKTTKTDTLLSFNDLKKIISNVGGFSGTDPDSNVLALFVDYSTNILYFSSDPSGKVKAANGNRRFMISLDQAFNPENI